MDNVIVHFEGSLKVIKKKSQFWIAILQIDIKRMDVSQIRRPAAAFFVYLNKANGTGFIALEWILNFK